MANSCNYEIGVPDFPELSGPITLEESVSAKNEHQRTDRSYRKVETGLVMAI